MVLGLVLAMAACASPTPASQSQARSGQPTDASQPRGGTKTITVGVTAGVQAMSIMGSGTTSGGWMSMNEIHSNGLVTSDNTTRKPVGRLASKVPTPEDGSVSVLPDGRMRVAYSLRPGITWQDGTPFTSKDLEFSYRINTDRGLPSIQRDSIDQMESVETPDATTFIVYFKGPYYLGATLGIRPFWPLPEHILGAPYERFLASNNADEVINQPYWTSEYVHLGPFRMTQFEPGGDLTFEAYDRYFLGRPKVDVVIVKAFNDQNTLFSNLLANAVDVFPDSALNAQLGTQIEQRWLASAGGKVYTREGITWFLGPQFRPEVQIEQAVLDPRVRAALYRALDREALADALQAGHRELTGWALLPPGDRLYPATRDGLRVFAYDVSRARAELQALGWNTAADGTLRSAVDNHQFRTALSTVPGRDNEIAAMAGYWREFGLQVEEAVVPASQVRDLQARAQYPGWDSSANGAGDAILNRMQGPAATAANRWTGDRGGYEDPRMTDLIMKYRTSLSEADQSHAMKSISDFMVAELPLLVLYFLPEQVGVRTGISALDDAAGGMEAAQPYGTYTRNAHLWDVIR